MGKITKEMREELIDAGRKDLVEVFDINASGYAGVLPDGNIVSRLEYPKAVPVPSNGIFGIRSPKLLKDDRTSDYVCVPCGRYFLTPEEIEAGGRISTAHTAECGVCGEEDMVLHIRVYHWLHHYKYKPKK